MNKTPQQMELGEMSPAKLGSRAAIRHGYESVLTASARLFSFATGKIPETEGPIGEHQEVLAADDLLALAIHARRLIDNTISLKRARQVSVRVWIEGKFEYKPITRINNVIVHNVSLRIFRTEAHLRIALGNWTIDDFMIGTRRYIDPICHVKSDQDNFIFRIAEFIETFQRKILAPVIEMCEEHHLWLDEDI
jgi:hypothetical protein